MKVYKAIIKLSERIRTAPNRLALTILMWVEKEPSNERILPWPALQQVPGDELRHRIREYRKCLREHEVA
jgi:hypothetical protein